MEGWKVMFLEGKWLHFSQVRAGTCGRLGKRHAAGRKSVATSRKCHHHRPHIKQSVA